MHFCLDEFYAFMMLLDFVPGVKYMAHRLWTWRHRRACSHDGEIDHTIINMVENALEPHERMKTAAKRIKKEI